MFHTNEFIVCHALSAFIAINLAMHEISIINLFIERLRISFNNTPYQLNKCTNYFFRIFYGVIWIILCVRIII